MGLLETTLRLTDDLLANSFSRQVGEIFGVFDESQHPRDAHGKFTDAGGQPMQHTLASKATQLASMGYKLTLANEKQDVWKNATNGATVKVSHYNTSHPGNANLRKYEVYSPIGTKMFTGHQFAKVLEQHQALSGQAPVPGKPAEQKPDASIGSKFTSFPKQQMLGNNGFKYVGSPSTGDWWKQEGASGMFVKMLSDSTGPAGSNKWELYDSKGAKVSSGQGTAKALEKDINNWATASKIPQATFGKLSGDVEGTLKANGWIKTADAAPIVGNNEVWKHEASGTFIQRTAGGINWRVISDGGNKASPWYNNAQTPLVNQNNIMHKDAIDAMLKGEAAAKTKPLDPTIPATAKNQALKDAGFKVTENSKSASTGLNMDVWKHPDGTQVNITDMGDSKSTYQVIDKNQHVLGVGKYMNDMQQAISQAQGGAKPTSPSTSTPSQPKSTGMVANTPEFQKKVADAIASTWDKKGDNAYGSAAYSAGVKAAGISASAVAEVAGKVGSWQIGTTANDGNPLGKQWQDIVSGAAQVHAGAYFEYAHTQEWIKQNGVPNGGTFYRGLQGSASTSGAAATITMLNLVAKISPEYNVMYKMVGAEGFSTSSSKAKDFSGGLGSNNVLLTKVNVDPKNIMSGKGINPGMWKEYPSEQEYALAYPNGLMPIDSKKGDKITAAALRDRMLQNALDKLQEMGWQYEFKGKDLILTPPPQPPGDWLRWMRRGWKPTVNAVSPPGWSGTVQHEMDKGIDNPYALAWWQYQRGETSHKEPVPGHPGAKHVSRSTRKARTKALKRKKVKSAADSLGPGSLQSTVAECRCGHPFDEHSHPPDFSCDVEGCNCNGFDEIDAAREMLRERALGIQSKAHKLAGYVSWQGLPVSIENKKGSVRSGINSVTKKKWSVTMPFDYGYLKGTKGADGQGIDVFMGPTKDAKFVYVIHQTTPDGVVYDEDKVMLNFRSADVAKAAYCAAYDNGGTFFHSMTVLPVHAFIQKVLRTREMKRPGKIHAMEAA